MSHSISSRVCLTFDGVQIFHLKTKHSQKRDCLTNLEKYSVIDLRNGFNICMARKRLQDLKLRHNASKLVKLKN